MQQRTGNRSAILRMRRERYGSNAAHDHNYGHDGPGKRHIRHIAVNSSSWQSSTPSGSHARSVSTRLMEIMTKVIVCRDARQLHATTS